MFERFTDQARRVIVLAQEEARLLHHNYIGTEHFLLGVISEGDGVGAQALDSLGITLHDVRSQVDRIAGTGQQSPTGHIPFTPRAKKVLELSHRESLQLGHDYIGTEHILLGLIRVSEGAGAQVLIKLGADPIRVHDRVLQLLEGQVGGRATAAHAEPGPMELRLGRQILPRITAIDARLAALEQRVGIGAETVDIDQQVARIHAEMQEAARAENFERAANLRDQEKRLLADKAARQQEWKAAHPNLADLAEECRRLGDQVDRLQALLHEHGIDPQDRTA